MHVTLKDPLPWIMPSSSLHEVHQPGILTCGPLIQCLHCIVCCCLAVPHLTMHALYIVSTQNLFEALRASSLCFNKHCSILNYKWSQCLLALVSCLCVHRSTTVKAIPRASKVSEAMNMWTEAFFWSACKINNTSLQWLICKAYHTMSIVKGRNKH